MAFVGRRIHNFPDLKASKVQTALAFACSEYGPSRLRQPAAAQDVVPAVVYIYKPLRTYRAAIGVLWIPWAGSAAGRPLERSSERLILAQICAISRQEFCKWKKLKNQRLKRIPAFEGIKFAGSARDPAARPSVSSLVQFSIGGFCQSRHGRNLTSVCWPLPLARLLDWGSSPQ